MREISETARAREVYRFAASAIAATHFCDESQIGSSPLNTNFKADSVLTSLAQLATVRFDGDGALISLFDAHRQYFLAHATKTSPILPVEHDDEHDHCYLRGKAIPRPGSFCEDVLLESGINKSKLPDERDCGQRPPVSVVPDISSSPSSSRPVGIPGLPDARFYAAVPIRSTRGINIGVLAVYGMEARTEIEPHLISLLRDLSTTVTSHLMSTRSRIELRRSERMVRGLGSFVEGTAGMSFSPTALNLESFRNEGFEGTLNSGQQNIQRADREKEQLAPFFANEQSILTENPQTTPLHSASPSPVAELPARSKSFSPPEAREPQEHEPSKTAISSHATKIDSSGLTNGHEDEHMSSVKHLFSRAANIIRESIEVEGVVFVDASLSSFGGLVGMNDNSDTSHSNHSSSEESRVDIWSDDSDNMCDVLGYSTTTSSSLDDSATIPEQMLIPEKFLKALLRRYPEGKIYHFGGGGSISAAGDSSENEPVTSSSQPPVMSSVSENSLPSAHKVRKRRRSTEKWSRQTEGRSLLKLIPDATAVVILPLWDYDKDRWYAGGIVWTCTPARSFTKEADLSYLRAFGMSILSELARLEVQTFDKAKSDILGSISHELRSPLHGVVAAAELLRDTSLDAFQCDVLHSLESCGRVLLDVLNHLLDYTKINSVMQDRKPKHKTRKSKAPASPSQPRRFNQSRLSTYTHIDSLFEESIDSVFAGHAFQKLSIAQLDHKSDRNADAMALHRNDTLEAVESFGHQTGAHGQLDIHLGDVCVLIDIDPNVPWGFRAQPGALRRIVLNILGNSLRFTDRGLIVVTLRQEKNISRKSSLDTNIILTITDTGRGIGSYFMQHHLFTPFSQEDRLSSGTGLGLTLVKKIVKNLHGSVSVQSKIGVGTCVQITVPVPQGTQETQAGSNFTDHRTALAGLRVSLFGLGETIWRSVGDEPLVSEVNMMHKICSEWLQLHVVEYGNEEIRPDLFLCGEASMNELLRDTGKRLLSAPIIVICKNAVVAHAHNKAMSEKTGHRVIEFISQPIGPRRLAKSLDTALRRWAEAAQAELPDLSPDIATPRLQPSTMTWPVGALLQETNVAENPDANGVSMSEPVIDTNNLHGSPEQRIASPEHDGHDERPANSLHSEPKDLENVVRKSSETPRGNTGITLLTDAARDQKILLVDDNPINLRILMTYMKKLKKPFKTATNGLEALETFTADPPSFNCILMDLSMPIMGGLESTRKIRELERTLELTSTTTIIALTGLASLKSQQEAYASGIDLYFTKPVKLQGLAKTLQERGI
ncbi:hypothetical protein F5Y18DRAFT_407017 [Xylariaceae sp. FL1019]|nr:hypothetical protein F5Y18DRAFT_407017 [Xylariaceae sp. FL1019]